MALLDYCRLVMLLASYCAFAHALCEDVTDCSARCNPEHWRRQLCVFYTELMEWRATAVRCGLDVPEFVWDSSQSSTTQWEEARLLWNSLRLTWRQLAEEEGILMSSRADMTDELVSSATGSGIVDVLDDDDDVSDSVTSVTGDRVSVWREEQDKWTADFKVWKSHIKDTGSTSQGAESSVDPSDLWMDNLSGWSNSFTLYNTTFYEICTTTLMF